ncbi:MAG: M2 family metallopeptidase [Sedimentisphaerales bacterium]|jgi:peptidyl-dipeptidase A|nr:M2 family metallopeptidase [Sedimentisphaerales bacterium]
MKVLSIAIVMFAAAVLLFGCNAGDRQEQGQKFVDAHVKKIKPIVIKANLADWDAAVSGKSEDYDKAGELRLKIRRIYSDSRDYAFVKDLKDSGQITDAVLARQIDRLYYAYLKNQIEPELLKEIVDLSTEIEKNFSTFRGTIDNRKVTSNEIRDILKTQIDSTEREEAWLASKQVGPVVADDLIRLVKLRNKAARKVGFENYHTLILTTGEQDVEELDRIFNRLYELTNEPFRQLKADLDRVLAQKYDVAVTELMPWHYHDPFFQESPMVYDLDLDAYYKGKDVKELSIKFYGSIGLDVESIIAKSDLYEREGKNPHAFCTDIDREGDIRILCNLKNNEQWMETQLHELGHAVYDKYQSPTVPYLLRHPAHIFTTEAIAMFFGRLSRNPDWMQQMLDLSDEQREEIEKVSAKYAQLKQLIFARWDMVMYEFEKQLYANPDQDLNNLWWDIVEKYQFMKRPGERDEPDWAAKIHFTIAPCYYHNYLLGELFASQLHQYIVSNVLELESDEGVSYVGQRKVGEFMHEKVFEAGAVYRWNRMIELATGEPLSPKYFVAQFVK